MEVFFLYLLLILGFKINELYNLHAYDLMHPEVKSRQYKWKSVYYYVYEAYKGVYHQYSIIVSSLCCFFYYPLVLILWYQHDHISYKFFIFSRHSTVSNILILCLRYAEYFNQGAQCRCNMLACMSYNCGTKEARNVRFHYFYYYLFSLYCPLLLMCILSMLCVSCGSAGQRNSVRIFFSFYVMNK